MVRDLMLSVTQRRSLFVLSGLMAAMALAASAAVWFSRAGPLDSEKG